MERKDFQEMFNNKVYNVPNTDYQAWLQYKLLSIGSEKEAFSHVLASRMPKSIPKKLTNRKDNKPKGVDRYDPLSKAWTDCLTKSATKSPKNKVFKATKQSTSNTLSTEPSDPVNTATVSDDTLGHDLDNVNISPIQTPKKVISKKKASAAAKRRFLGDIFSGDPMV